MMMMESLTAGGEELRVDESDGLAYPLSSFVEVYGEAQGRAVWAAAAPFHHTTGTADDGHNAGDGGIGGSDSDDGNTSSGDTSSGDGVARRKRIRLESSGGGTSSEKQQGGHKKGVTVPSSAAPAAPKVRQIDRLKALGPGAVGVSQRSAVFRNEPPRREPAATATNRGARSRTSSFLLEAEEVTAVTSTSASSTSSSTSSGGGGGSIGTAGVCLGPGCAPVANNFLRGLKFSPDGLCMLTNSEDSTLRVFDLFDGGGGGSGGGDDDGRDNDNGAAWNPVLQMHEGGMVYDFDWYPRMDSRDPASCVRAFC